MINKTDTNNASFAYSVNMLRMILKMKLITEDEYRKIVSISAEYYGTEVVCV
ncbi:MAG: SHOCT domain-containing protein [Monoglobaceae bacterium]